MLYAPAMEQRPSGLVETFEELGRSAVPAFIYGLATSGYQEAPVWYALSDMFIGGALGEIIYEVVRFVRDKRDVLAAVNRAHTDIDRRRENKIRLAFITVGAVIGLVVYSKIPLASSY